MPDTQPAEPSRQVAQALRALRRQRGWSLDRAAQASGVSKAMLGQIERGESSPTIATLWKIATGFQTSLSSLLEAPLPVGIDGVVQRAADLLRQRPATDGMLVALLFPYTPEFSFELLELTLLPGYQRLSEPHEAGVTEHVVVLRGNLDVLVEGQWMALGEGDAVRFAADQPHGYRNRQQTPAAFHNLIHYATPAARIQAAST